MEVSEQDEAGTDSARDERVLTRDDPTPPTKSVNNGIDEVWLSGYGSASMCDQVERLEQWVKPSRTLSRV